jgi:glutaredoxin
MDSHSNQARRCWLTLALVLWALIGARAWPATAAAESTHVTAHIFWQEGCPYCSRAKAALREIALTDKDLSIDEIELGVDPANDALFDQVRALLALRDAAVPLVVIGARYVVGFSSAVQTPAIYEGLIARCRKNPCPDLVAEARRLSDIAAGRAAAGKPAVEAAPAGPPSTVTVPLLGEIALTDLSLPVLTIVLAGIDGFNPCAMWVLVLLIGLLVGVVDSRRMWTLGLVFLIATGAMYFAVMAAWLNVVLWIGAVIWLRAAIGALAIGAGVYYLREYWANPEGFCRITAGARRRRFTDAFRRVVEQPSLALAAFGIATLAIVVNLVELACSAGVPAVYTQLLAMHDLSVPGHYAYLALYLVIFLLDDIAVFVTAMVTLRSAVLTGRYTRNVHLVGGAVLLALGWVMLLRPEWLG